MSSKVAFLDFEFRGVSEPELDLVCVYVETTVDGNLDTEGGFWLHRDEDAKARARAYFSRLIRMGYVFVAYAAEAEMRSLLTLFKDSPSITHKIKWIDLYLEYRCLLNRSDRFSYGQQLIDGRVVTTAPPPPKWYRVDSHKDDEGHSKPSYGLAAACFKLLGILIDTDEKTAVRDIIINGSAEDIASSRDRIMAYCREDVRHLKPLQRRIAGHFVSGGFLVEDWKRGAFLRGDYASRTARMVATGYAVNLDKVKALTANVDSILSVAAEDCIAELPGCFEKQKSGRYKQTQKVIREWIEKQALPHWRRTDTKALSISKDAFGDWYKSDSEGFPGAFCRYLKTKQSLNGFLPGGKKGSFFDYVGSDSRVRPYFGIYGSQSSRSQPSATGFIPLKAHWVRNFLDPKRGRAVCGVDYSSQEFLIAAILSQDLAMMRAYQSGDVYLAFGKDAKVIPHDGTKASHPTLREVCKALVLGISYDMSAKGLAPRLTAISGDRFTEDQAQNLIDLFYSVYGDYADWKTETLREYEDEGKLVLPDGWAMWGDNDNPRSVGNFPVQGHGAVIMREAVKIAQDAGLDVVFTLHDAIYIEYDSPYVDAIERLQAAMQRAFSSVMGRYGKIIPIRLEGEAWSPDYAELKPRQIAGIEYLPEYIDTKGKADLERYRKFFQTPQTP